MNRIENRIIKLEQRYPVLKHKGLLTLVFAVDSETDVAAIERFNASGKDRHYGVAGYPMEMDIAERIDVMRREGKGYRIASYTLEHEKIDEWFFVLKKPEQQHRTISVVVDCLERRIQEVEAAIAPRKG